MRVLLRALTRLQRARKDDREQKLGSCVVPCLDLEQYLGNQGRNLHVRPQLSYFPRPILRLSIRRTYQEEGTQC